MLEPLLHALFQQVHVDQLAPPQSEISASYQVTPGVKAMLPEPLLFDPAARSAQLTNMVKRTPTLSAWNSERTGTAGDGEPPVMSCGLVSSKCIAAQSRPASNRGAGSVALQSAGSARQITVLGVTPPEAITGILNCAPIANVNRTAVAGSV